MENKLKDSFSLGVITKKDIEEYLEDFCLPDIDENFDDWFESIYQDIFCELDIGTVFLPKGFKNWTRQVAKNYCIKQRLKNLD